MAKPASPFHLASRSFCTELPVVGEREKSRIPEPVFHEVVFCGSAERVNEGWLIFFWENDRRIRHGVVPDKLIAPSRQAIPRAAGHSYDLHSLVA